MTVSLHFALVFRAKPSPAHRLLRLDTANSTSTIRFLLISTCAVIITHHSVVSITCCLVVSVSKDRTRAQPPQSDTHIPAVQIILFFCMILIFRHLLLFCASLLTKTRIVSLSQITTTFETAHQYSFF